MSNEIVRSTNVIQSVDDVERAARAMSASGFFPDSKSAAQAFVKVLAGRELGFGAFASMTGVAVIQGKPVIGANLLAAAVKQTGKYNYRVTKHTDQECEITFFEGSQQVGISTFTMKDAQAAGLSAKDNWKKYPRNMLFARAIANGQKWYAPDVFNGVTVYTPDEMGASVDGEGNIIDVKPETGEYPVDPNVFLSENTNQETGEIADAVELVKPMDSWCVEYAAKAWNVSAPEAAKAIASKKLGKQISKTDFIQIVNEG